MPLIEPPHALPEDTAPTIDAVLAKVAELEADTTTDKELLALIKVLACVAFQLPLWG